jgi:hypothetical protein
LGPSLCQFPALFYNRHSRTRKKFSVRVDIWFNSVKGRKRRRGKKSLNLKKLILVGVSICDIEKITFRLTMAKYLLMSPKGKMVQ